MSTAPIPEYGAAHRGRPLRDGRSLGDLFKELGNEVARLFQQEVLLARTEVSEKVGVVGRNTAFLAVGGAIAYAGLLFIILSFCALLSWGLYAAGLSGELAIWLGTLIVGLIVTGIGYLLLQKGMSTLKKRDSYVPDKTIESLQEDAAWIRKKVA